MQPSASICHAATIALAVALAFAFGYAFTMFPLRRSGMPWRQVMRLALAADTASITIMEIVDNGDAHDSGRHGKVRTRHRVAARYCSATLPQG